MAFFSVVEKILKFSDALLKNANGFVRVSQPNRWSPALVGDLPDRGVVWAVPTRRVSLERRLMRRISHPFFRIKPKDYIKSCHICGHFHLAHSICGHCYGKVKQETEQLRDTIAKELKLEPVEEEVVIAYQGEEKQGGRRVKVDRPRPAWFSKNLMKQSSS
ncbi:large ribosomal subunit protein bL32m [Dermacentor andersoni]|uniref:large ribosomal subunit protein bL32m n=1 Tax=Dermacentor andersoni TaxID=34620 RepID=UPI0024165706|nr:39S ribosomal protein L32, mitochondrial-like [Dermacentor andersoni]